MQYKKQKNRYPPMIVPTTSIDIANPAEDGPVRRKKEPGKRISTRMSNNK
jgi:hypothetical protein